MKKFKTTLIVILLLVISAFGASNVMAQEQASGSSAALNSPISVRATDNRVEILREYLIENDSPLAPYAQDFIDSADRHNLDWRLVASIAGLESSFGKHQPTGSHNGWGWGYNNGTVKQFNSWEEAIEEISKGLRENYLYDNPVSDPYLIGPKYAASPTWAVRVTFFMNKMEAYRLRNAKSTLVLAL